MKFKVLNRFRDKFSHEIFEVGSEYETDDANRADLLKSHGFLGEEIINNEYPYAETLNQSIDKIKEVTDGLGKEHFQKLIDMEKQGKNRSSLVEYFDEVIKAFGDDQV